MKTSPRLTKKNAAAGRIEIGFRQWRRQVGRNSERGFALSISALVAVVGLAFIALLLR